MPQWVTVLGATGSIGASTLDVIARHPERYRVYALSGRSRWQALAEQCRRFQPLHAVVADEQTAQWMTSNLADMPTPPTIHVGETALAEIASAPQVDMVMAAIVGAAGLLPTLAAVHAGKRVLLANKEALVMSGGLLMAAVKEHGAVLLPIDSEHNAIFQCLPEGRLSAGVSGLLLTASGGPFLHSNRDELARVTPAQAVKHPNWSMGQKISVDSATLMNKGLELIEACWLFGVSEVDVEVVVHPQSVVHSMVRYRDGSVLAQLGEPDMRTPIAHAMAWPERMEAGVKPLDFKQLSALTFLPPDESRFPCLRLAREAMRAGGTAPAILNAANEEAVAAFLAGQIGFLDIPRVIEATRAQLSVREAADLATILTADNNARTEARAHIQQCAYERG